MRDASQEIRYILQPGRITELEVRAYVKRNLELKNLPERGWEVCLKAEGLRFFWLGQYLDGLADAVRQEVDPNHPHCYTTFPVKLTHSSTVLDVGTCEGLFAFRRISRGQAARVHCFEPSSRTAAYLKKGVEINGFTDRINIEIAAVGSISGQVFFSDSDAPEANRVLESEAAGASRVRQVTLDQYCMENKVSLNSTDLIKVDAEGADVDVIRGASQLIRERSPQIAVTTYHNPAHAEELIHLLRSLQPKYRLRLKGFTLWNSESVPRPVLLQAAL